MSRAIRPHLLWGFPFLLLGTAWFSPGLHAQSSSPCELMMDVNDDGTIGTYDLLGLLSIYGASDLDFDCVWDHMDPCVNGEGDCVAELSAPCQGMSSVTYQGYNYPLVEIAGDCWFAENLRTETYANGDSITSSEEYFSEVGGIGDAEGYSFSYGEAYTANFGRLYNWFATIDDRGLCPQNWHVSTENEWRNVELSLGMPEEELDNPWVFRGNEAPLFKDASWNYRGDGSFGGGSNVSGLAIKGGAWYFGGSVSGHGGIGQEGYYINSTQTYDPVFLANFDDIQWVDSLCDIQFPVRVTNDGQIHVKDGFFHREFWKDYDGVRLWKSNGWDGSYQRLAMSVRCVLNQSAAGEACDDGFIGTHNDHWPEDGTGPCFGDLSIETDGSGPCAGDFALTYNGMDYALIELDNRCWFKENLHAEVFSNGDSIPFVEDWNNLSFPAMISAETAGNNFYFLYPDEYFYNSYVAEDPRGVCPTGWSVPSISEWSSLIQSFGGLESYRTQNLVGPGWASPNNSGGFSVLYTGHYYPQMPQMAYHTSFLNRDGWWGNDDPAIPFGLPSMYDPNSGLSIRCVKNVE
jgi:uncharacterized protein (TIGR02145 family)